MSEKNIELFDLYAAYALSSLYKSFPMPHEFRTNEMLDELEPQIEAIFDSKLEVRQADPNSPMYKYHRPSRADQIRDGENIIDAGAFWGFSVGWLFDSGYVRPTKPEGACTTNIATRPLILTAQALAAMKVTPTSLTKAESLGESMMRLTESVREETGRAALKETIGRFIAMAASVASGMG